MAKNAEERGLEVLGELLGEQAQDAMKEALASDGFASDIAGLACEFAFAKVWDRDGLERKHRSLIIIATLIAQRQTNELKNHVRIGLNNGLTVKELEETLIQTLPYVGFPAVASATTAFVEVLRERGIDVTTRTAEEQGLL